MVHPLFGANFEGWGKATLHDDDDTMEPVLSDTHTHAHNPVEHYLTTHVSQSSLGNLLRGVGRASSWAKNNVGSIPVSREGCSLLAEKLACFF